MGNIWFILIVGILATPLFYSFRPKLSFTYEELLNILGDTNFWKECVENGTFRDEFERIQYYLKYHPDSEFSKQFEAANAVTLMCFRVARELGYDARMNVKGLFGPQRYLERLSDEVQQKTQQKSESTLQTATQIEID